MDKYNQ